MYTITYRKAHWGINLTILKTENLNYIYGEGTPFKKIAITNINIEIEKGCFLGLIGHTGSGKSTLVQHFNGLLKPTSGKVFVENEIRILEKHFDKIIIICAIYNKMDIVRYIPKNADVFVFNENISLYQKLKGIQFFFKKIFWQEILFARKNLNIKFNFIKLKILYIDLIKGYLLSKYTNKVCNKYPLAPTYYYSYWSDYEAVACAFLKKKNPQKRSWFSF